MVNFMMNLHDHVQLYQKGVEPCFAKRALNLAPVPPFDGPHNVVVACPGTNAAVLR